MVAYGFPSSLHSISLDSRKKEVKLVNPLSIFYRKIQKFRKVPPRNCGTSSILPTENMDSSAVDLLTKLNTSWCVLYCAPRNQNTSALWSNFTWYKYVLNEEHSNCVFKLKHTFRILKARSTILLFWIDTKMNAFWYILRLCLWFFKYTYSKVHFSLGIFFHRHWSLKKYT